MLEGNDGYEITEEEALEKEAGKVGKELNSVIPREVFNPYVLEALNSASERIEDSTAPFSSFTSFSSWSRSV